MDDNDRLVTVYVSTDVGRLEVIQAALGDAGIDSAIENERQAALTGVLESRLLVRADDETAAREFIAEHERAGENASS